MKVKNREIKSICKNKRINHKDRLYSAIRQDHRRYLFWIYEDWMRDWLSL